MLSNDWRSEIHLYKCWTNFEIADPAAWGSVGPRIPLKDSKDSGSSFGESGIPGIPRLAVESLMLPTLVCGAKELSWSLGPSSGGGQECGSDWAENRRLEKRVPVRLSVRSIPGQPGRPQ